MSSSVIKLKIAYFCNLCYLVFEMSIPIFFGYEAAYHICKRL